MNAEQFKRFKALRAAGVTTDKATQTLHVARSEAAKANRCETYEDYAKIAGKKPKKPKAAQPKPWHPGCRHTKTCVYWKRMGTANGALYGCHYPIEVGELRPWPADQCPGFKEPVQRKNKSFDFD